ncbi:CHAT domain-containing protein [Amycolatopsis sp. cg5]|uniref:CHAT domain-containing protein n=1 Tax=Amycolatopsis sp. cg5 TaxID=3238802 RepID=UPI0035243250
MRAVEAARDLYDRAQKAASDSRPAVTAKLLQRALRVLGPELQDDVNWLEVSTKVLISLASAEAETKSPSSGLKHLDTAESLRVRMPDCKERAFLRFTVGLQRAIMLARIGRLADSVALFDALLPSVDAEVEDNKLLLTTDLLNRSYVHVLMNNPEAARADLRRCLALAEEFGHHGLAGGAWHGLGDLAQLEGDVPEALRNYERAGEIYKSTTPGWLPLLRKNQAVALLTAGLAEDAAAQLDELMPELVRMKAAQDIAEAEVARAAAAILEGDFELARKYAATARRRFLRRGNARWAAVASLARLRAGALGALANQARKPPPRLLRELSELAPRLAELGLRDEAAAARLLAVRLHLRRGAVDEAETLLSQVPKPRQTTPIDHRMLLRLCRAELAVATGRSRAALAQARAGLTELGAIRDRMGGLDLVCGTAVHGQELGRLALKLVLGGRRDQSQAKQLFAWQELTRAQVYRYEPLPVIEDPVLARHITEMRQVQGTIQRNRLHGESVSALEKRYSALQSEARRLGWYTSPWGKPRPVATNDEIVEALGDRVLASVVSDGETLFCVIIRDGEFSLTKLGDRAEVIETVKQLHADLDALAPDHLPPMLAEAVAGSASRRAEKLDKLLRASLTEQFADRELVIIPIGPLYVLPWAVLPSLRGRPLTVAPSATAWLSAMKRPHASPVLLAGGPGVPGAIGEVSQLRAVYPGARLIDGTAATSAAVLQALEGSGTAHLVAHGAHEPANALFSRLELVDGPLFAHETARLTRPPERVVLAACELAMSHIRPGEEALGFAGTLLASGSRTVIGAIARVGDRAAAEAMSDLHQQLAAGIPPATALAEATAIDPFRRPFLCLGAG